MRPHVRGYDTYIHIYIHGLCVPLTAAAAPPHLFHECVKSPGGHTQLFLINAHLFPGDECAIHSFRMSQNQRDVS